MLVYLRDSWVSAQALIFSGQCCVLNSWSCKYDGLLLSVFELWNEADRWRKTLASSNIYIYTVYIQLQSSKCIGFLSWFLVLFPQLVYLQRWLVYIIYTFVFTFSWLICGLSQAGTWVIITLLTLLTFAIMQRLLRLSHTHIINTVKIHDALLINSWWLTLP